jgi:hypothetical protein
MNETMVEEIYISFPYFLNSRPFGTGHFAVRALHPFNFMYLSSPLCYIPYYCTTNFIRVISLESHCLPNLSLPTPREKLLQKSKIKNQKSKIEHQKSKIENLKSKIENRKSKI